MQNVRSKNSGIEIILRQALWKKGLRYRIHVSDVFGKPDIAIKGIKLAIFVDSEFWHGYNWNVRADDFKSNRGFWLRKIERNIQRDKEVNQELCKSGWTVLRYWGNDIKRNADNVANEIIETYRRLNV